MSVIDAIIAKKLCGGGGSVPKPLTFDYMPEGYPTKTAGTVTVMEEQELAFAPYGNGFYEGEVPTNPFEVVVGKTYTVTWDRTEYECVCFDFNSTPTIGNRSLVGAGDDTGEPFMYSYNSSLPEGDFVTLDTSASHTISVTTAMEVIIPMSEDFLPTAAKNTTVFYV